jgi:hypothetical protein
MLSARATPFAARAMFQRLSISETPWISDRDPRPDQKVAALAFDGRQRYVLPFPCSCDDGTWHNANTGSVMLMQIVGWCAVDVKAIAR